jgi:hypothetical protein
MKFGKAKVICFRNMPHQAWVSDLSEFSPAKYIQNIQVTRTLTIRVTAIRLCSQQTKTFTAEVIRNKVPRLGLKGWLTPVILDTGEAEIRRNAD